MGWLGLGLELWFFIGLGSVGLFEQMGIWVSFREVIELGKEFDGSQFAAPGKAVKNS